METRHKAYKYRIYPNKEQQVLLAKSFGSVRFVYNHYLDVKSRTYEETGRSLSYTDCAKDLVVLKKEKIFLQEVDSIALQQALRHLDTAFRNFFRDQKVGYPKYKSRKHHHYSYTTVYVNRNIRLEKGVLTLPKIGKVRIKQHRAIPEGYILKSVTVSQTPTGKYYASVLFDHEVDIQPAEIVNQRKDYLHKLSGQIANAYDLVCVEDLNMQSMSQRLNFGKSVTDDAWGTFLRFLDYKLAEQGKRLIKIDKWVASSKTCHVCGNVYEELALSTRRWECPVCHTLHDRDWNAAQNIKAEGMRMMFA